MKTVAIVGGGLGGAVVAQSLRTEGFDGQVLMFGDEPYQPYDRPALSKSALLDRTVAPTDIVAADWDVTHQVAFRRGVSVHRIDSQIGGVVLADGALVRADRIVLCTGSRARRLQLPGSQLPGVHYLRTWPDAMALRQAIQPGVRLTIIGGGLIGCEMATTATRLGARVSVLEVGTELMERVLGPVVGAFCRDELAQLGVKVHLKTEVAALEGTERVSAVRTASGQRLETDLVLVCIGGQPNSEIAMDAGLRCAGGVDVNGLGQTSVAAIYAAGDVARWPVVSGGQRCLETYINTQNQAATVAKALLGAQQEALQIPRSWTDIAGHKLQMVGDIAGPGRILERHKSPGGAGVYFRVDDAGRVQAAISVDAPGDFSAAIRLVEKRIAPCLQQLADTAVALRDLLRTPVTS